MSTEKIKSPAKKIKATILFVDDEKNILSSLNRLFRPVIENIITAEGGQEGLEILKTVQVDIVISDMKMPEMDGAQFLAQVADKYPDTIRILLTGYADVTSTIDAINKGNIYRYISKPWEDNDIRLTIVHALKGKFIEKEKNRLQALSESQNLELKELNEDLENRVKSRTEEVRQTMGQLQLTHNSLKNSYQTTIKVFSNIIELREASDSTLTNNISELVEKMAEQVGMSKEETQQVVFASQLRNLGRIGLPDELNKKSFGDLNNEEKSQVMRHCLIGQGILMSLEYLNEASTYIRHQYERFDGKGYPDQLQGKSIPFGARIITLASDYYSMQFGKFSSEKMTTKDSLDYIQRNRNIRYDPILINVMLKILGISNTDNNEIKQKKILERTVFTHELEEGMVLTRNLTMKNGVVLLAKGQKITSNLIRSILKMESSVNEKLDVFIAG